MSSSDPEEVQGKNKIRLTPYAFANAGISAPLGMDKDKATQH